MNLSAFFIDPNVSRVEFDARIVLDAQRLVIVGHYLRESIGRFSVNLGVDQTKEGAIAALDITKPAKSGVHMLFSNAQHEQASPRVVGISFGSINIRNFDPKDILVKRMRHLLREINEKLGLSMTRATMLDFAKNNVMPPLPA